MHSRFSLIPAQKHHEQRIWQILEQAIESRKQDGSAQWQNGYPNPEVVADDVERGVAYILSDQKDVVAGYAALILNDEPAYEKIDGAWLSDGSFVVLHRIAIAKEYKGNSLSRVILQHAARHAVVLNAQSLRVDTNFDNLAMIKTFEREGYIYCGEVQMGGGTRRAYEKVLKSPL